MNPALIYSENAEQLMLAIGAVQFFTLWAVASLASIGLVWLISRWLDR